MSLVRSIAWRHPHWWMLAATAAAWILLVVRPGHAHHYSLADWTLMSVAMMLPLVLDHVAFVAARSLWRRRHRSMVLFIAGCLAAWLLAGLLVVLLYRMIGGAIAIALIWQVTPWQRRAVIACHGTVPLAPDGWRADRDVVLYGWSIGLACLIACGGLMLACVAIGHDVLAMAAATAIALIDFSGWRPFAPAAEPGRRSMRPTPARRAV